MTQEANAECGICFDVPLEPRITACGHLFCTGWYAVALRRPTPSISRTALHSIEEHIDRKGSCPMDNFPLDRTALVGPGPSREGSSDEDEVLAWQAQAGNDALSSAAKTQQLLMLLQATEPGVKSLIFSQVRAVDLHSSFRRADPACAQWTTHLNCIEASWHPILPVRFTLCFGRILADPSYTADSTEA